MFKRHTIASKLLIYSLAVSLVPLIFFSIVSYKLYSANMEKELRAELGFKADNIVHDLRIYLKEKEQGASILSTRKTLIDTAPRLISSFNSHSSDIATIDKEISDYISYFINFYGYYDIFLLSPKGDMVFSYLKEGDLGANINSDPNKFSEILKVFGKAKETRQPALSDYGYYEVSKKPSIFIAAPVMNGGKFEGVVVCQIVQKNVDEFLGEYSSFGDTGEIVVGHKISDDEVLLQGGLRFVPAAAFKIKRKMGGPIALPMQKAVNGEKGIGFDVDYRGEKVLAQWQYFEPLHWGIVTKIDVKELYRPVYQLQYMLLIIGILSTLSVIFVSILVSRKTTVPIISLTKSARAVAGGDLNAKAEITSNDEVGELSRAFNQMSAGLKSSVVSIDELNKEIEIRKQVEERLRFLASIVESSSDAIIGKTLGGTIISWNKGAEDVYGYSASEIIGKSVSALAPVELKDEMIKILDGIRRGERVVHFETKRLTKDGREIYVSLTVSPIKNRSGSVVGASTIARDITSRKIMESRLNQTLLELKRSNKEMETFTYSASHDLRAPLRAISSFAQFMQEDYHDKLDETGRGYLEEIKSGAKKLDRLVQDLLTLSRVSRIRNPYEVVSTYAIIKNVFGRLLYDIKKKKVGVYIQAGLPSIKCDKVKMEQVFYNLLSNAVKFSSKGIYCAQRVEVGYRDAGNEHEFFVKDNCIGIEPKYHAQIFNIFARLHTDKEYEGTGAGLSIVKRVVEDHGGRIWVESELGQGAKFIFTIPKEPKKDILEQIGG